jgi:hypothetical protein
MPFVSTHDALYHPSITQPSRKLRATAIVVDSANPGLCLLSQSASFRCVNVWINTQRHESLGKQNTEAAVGCSGHTRSMLPFQIKHAIRYLQVASYNSGELRGSHAEEINSPDACLLA